ncbi:pentapeptide repeat-containing protein [Nostoc sp. UCD121]|uniref:pentapeptide repeat-containing protein n=1 Tax=unclassified Nostoc TaxID=2593658 RepID=UPI001629DCEA|nr:MULTISPECIES: pentapeptide repeat-containing protein [unclassified Nostoc]MBC1224571.1 pentapeptide repeat-containing protein [Nostoc sp. UCD120]MBC1279338.1 pentapeptide repeat-containing protein [Nostoc sp. UCD121]
MPAENYNEQNLVGNNFNGQYLNGSTFFKTSLNEVQFVGTQLRSTNFTESVWLNVNASNAIFAPSASFSTPTSFVGVTLENVNFSGADLSQVDLSFVNTKEINQFIYNRSIGTLYFDVDSTGGVSQVEIVKFSNNPALTRNDIVVV